MRPNETTQYLSSLINHEHHLSRTTPNDFKLDRFRRLLAAAGNPQDALNIIHIAGSKGKGSTAALTANILKCAGYKVGLYTSPHMTNYRERIRVLESGNERVTHDLFDDLISEEKLAFLVGHLRPLADEISQGELGGVTFYEFLTAVAFCFFLDQKVDCVILETGLGGRLDATNCCTSLIAAITSISLEHTGILGDTLVEIAAEKAAIIKEGTKKAVLAVQPSDVMEVLLKQCEDFNVGPMIVGKDIQCKLIGQDVSGLRFHLESDHYILNDARCSLLGAHQLENIATACGIIEGLADLKFDVSEQAMCEGIGTVFWPCRFEIINGEQRVIIDGAHNNSSAQALMDTYSQVFGSKEYNVVIGISDDKDVRGILEHFENAKRIIATRANHPRAYKFTTEELTKMLDKTEIHLTDTVEQAIDIVSRIIPVDEAVIVTGSLFVASEARRLWRN